jgi:hypothetical protein
MAVSEQIGASDEPGKLDFVSTAIPGGPGAEVAERALNLAAGASPDAAGELLTMVEGGRRPLEEARKLLGDRLHRRSDDFAATRALCTVGAALSRVGWDEPHLRIRGPRRHLHALLWPWSGRWSDERPSAPPGSPA